ETASGKELYNFTAHRAVVTAVAFHPNGNEVASASADMTTRLWDLATGKEWVPLRGHAAVTGLAYSPDGQRLATCSADHLVKVWNLSQPTAEPLKLAGHSGPLSSVAFSPDGRYLLSGGGDPLIKLWDVLSGIEVRSFRGHKDWVTSVTF